MMNNLAITLVVLLTYASTVHAEHVISSGDLVKIVVYDEPELSLEILVDSMGEVSYPFIGSLSMKGKTVGEVKRKIVSGLKDGYLIDPEVTVTVVKYRQFFVNGRVKNPGGFSYEPGITIQKSISLAGGFDARAKKDEIYLTRGKDGERKKISPETLVHPGDVITVGRSYF